MAPKQIVKAAPKAPKAAPAIVACKVVLTSQRVQLSDISVEEGCSGWRGLDKERLAVLRAEFVAGNWGVGLHRPVRLLKSMDGQSTLLDARGLMLIDDGLHTVSCLKDLQGSGEAVECPKLLDIFAAGLPVDFVSYAEDSRDLRIMCQTLAHDSESNQYKDVKSDIFAHASIFHICVLRFKPTHHLRAERRPTWSRSWRSSGHSGRRWQMVIQNRQLQRS